jgi:hypothetical protein
MLINGIWYYTWANDYFFPGDNGGVGSGSSGGSSPDIGIGISNGGSTAISPGAGQIDLTISNLAGTTYNKNAIGVYYAPQGGTATDSYGGAVVGTYGGDTNAITALRVIPQSGTLSTGTCSLYGLSTSGGSNAVGGGGSVPLSGLTSALTSVSFDNSSYGQTWTWNSLTSGTAMTLSSSSITSGNVLSVQATSSGNTGSALYALNNSTSGWGIYSAGTSPNYFAGSVGIGNTAPDAPLALSTASTGSNLNIINALAGNQSGSEETWLNLGVSENTLDAGSMGFYYVSNGSTSNRLDFTFWGENQMMSVQGNGDVEIGTTSPVSLLTVNGDIDLAASSYLNFGSTDGTNGYGFRDSGGTMQRKNSGGSWATISTSSDQRLKRDIVDLPKEDGLSAIMKMRPVLFHWKDVDKDKEEGEQVGLIAQNVEKVFPSGDGITYNFGNVVMNLSGGKTETVEHARGMNYERLVAPLIKAVQEQEARIEALQAEVAALKSDAAKH